MRFMIILSVVILLGCGFFLSTPTTFAKESNWMPDPNLRQAVRDQLELPADIPLLKADMTRLTGLDGSKRGITDLTGLEYATHLQWTNLGENEIQELSPFAKLMDLEGLWIYANPITNLSPLAKLVNLKTLDLGGCRISNIRPLVNLTRLESLRLHWNRIEDITPLTNLAMLTELWLNANQVMNISPLENLTLLKELKIQNNKITDYGPLDTLTLVHLEYDEFCELPRRPIQERIDNRRFPSVFNAWHDILNLPALSYEARLARHDMHWSPEFGLHFQETHQGFEFVGSIKNAQAEREALFALNPNMLFLAEIRIRDAFLGEYYNEDWPYWIRDKEGNRVSAADDYPAFLIDFTHPDLQDIIVQQTIAVARCGLYDGIFLDWWSEEWNALYNYETEQRYRTLRAEVEAKVSILRRIREAVGDDFLILVNPNRSKVPRSAPYINGAFMETVRDYDGGYTHAGLREIEDTLLWSEENFRAPQINSLEGWGIETEVPNSPANLRWMRVFTTLGLTHSDGYMLYIIGIRHPIHEHDWRVFEITHKETHDQRIEHNHHHDHYWYDFWDADLGRPVGTKGQRYENREGIFSREFDNGWAVYNRSGKAQTVILPMEATGVESGITGRQHVLADLDGEIYLKESSTPADVNGDGLVNILDLVATANALGSQTPDLNGDGVVNILDVVIVANNF